MTQRFLSLAVIIAALACTSLITGCSSSESDTDPALPHLPDLNPLAKATHPTDSAFPPPLPHSNQPPPLPQGSHGKPPSLPSSPPTEAQPPQLPSTTTSAGHGSMLHVRQARIMDHQGFGRSMPAMHLLLPADWSDQGQVVWNPHTQCSAEARQFQWRASSPDGSETFEFLPGVGWGHSNYSHDGVGGCRLGMISSVRQYLETVAQQRRPSARIIGFNSLNQELDDLNREIQAINMPLPGVQSSRMWAEGGILEVSFQEHGREYQEQLMAIILLLNMEMDGGMRMQAGYAPAPMAMAYRFPAGQSYPLHLELMGESMRLDEEWSRQVMEIEANISGDAIRGMTERHQINMDTIAHIGNLSRASYNSRIGAMDRGSEQFSQTIRGVQTWTNPAASDQSFELPQDFNSAWRLDDGTFVLTNNPSFHPWNDLRQRGERLERVR